MPSITQGQNYVQKTWHKNDPSYQSGANIMGLLPPALISTCTKISHQTCQPYSNHFVLQNGVHRAPKIAKNCHAWYFGVPYLWTDLFCHHHQPPSCAPLVQRWEIVASLLALATLLGRTLLLAQLRGEGSVVPNLIQTKMPETTILHCKNCKMKWFSVEFHFTQLYNPANGLIQGKPYL